MHGHADLIIMYPVYELTASINLFWVYIQKCRGMVACIIVIGDTDSEIKYQLGEVVRYCLVMSLYTVH